MSDVAILAHEHLGDAVELRTLPTNELDHRLRQIRLRRYDRFALLIDDQRLIPAIVSRRSRTSGSTTLLVTGEAPISIDLLLEAAPAITKLVGSRRNTAEPMSGRVPREGYSVACVAPSEDMLGARHRDVGVVRDHLAATRWWRGATGARSTPIVSFIRRRSTASDYRTRAGLLRRSIAS
jgi:hypothetical protein